MRAAFVIVLAVGLLVPRLAAAERVGLIVLGDTSAKSTRETASSWFHAHQDEAVTNALPRDAVKTLPRGTAKGAKGNAVTAARAALTVDATRGDTQGEPQNALSEEAAHELDVKMGLAKPAQAIRHDGTRLILGVMTPAEARAELAKKGASK